MGQDRGAKVRRKMLELSISKHTHTHQQTFMYVYSGLSYEISQIINYKSSWHIIVIVIVAGLPRFSELAKLGLPVQNRS